MKVTDGELEGLKVIELKAFKDERGFFVEKFNAREFEKHGLPTTFNQDNHSYSIPGVVRGLHFQFDEPQGKLVSCVKGKILDVAVDLRPNSKTFGKSSSIILSAEAFNMFWIPFGFAHGFCVLGDEPADVCYKVTTVYNPQGEWGILWNDKDFNIKWPAEAKLTSPKDQKLITFNEFSKKIPQAFFDTYKK